MSVIIRVGQVWVNDKTGEEKKIVRIDCFGNCWWGGDSFSDKDQMTRHKFKPANDLEYLAVNCEKWNDEYGYIKLVNGKVTFLYKLWSGGYTKKQWQDKRAELYGDQIVNIDDIAKEEVKPVYTQKMADNGELPPVGCECLGLIASTGEYEKIKIVAHECGSCVAIKGASTLMWCNTFKPIDTRTEREKLIDELSEKIWDAVNEVDYDPMHPEFKHFKDPIKDEIIKFATRLICGQEEK